MTDTNKEVKAAKRKAYNAANRAKARAYILANKPVKADYPNDKATDQR